MTKAKQSTRLDVSSVRPIAAAVFALCTAVAVGGCKKDDDKEDAKTDEASKDEEATDDAKKDDASADGGESLPGVVAADALSPATQLQRGDVLAHVLLPNPSGFLGEIKTQAAPSAAKMFLDETMLRNLASGQLGKRSNVAKNVDLAKPMGCALVDATVTDVPLACIVGYTGGVDALVGDLGDQGKQGDAAGHGAHYVFEGNDIYLDALGDHVALSNHAEVFAKAKPYLESNMIGRADKVATDIEAVGYLDALGTRYQKQLQPILDEIGKDAPIPGDNKFADAMAAYNAKSTKDTIQRIHDMEQVTVGLGLEPRGFVARYAIFPKAGTKLEEQSKAAAAGTLNAEIVTSLPQSSWMVLGATTDWSAIWKTESFADVRKFAVEAYAEGVGKDATKVDEAVEEFFAESAELYGNDISYAVMHEPGTVGALLVSIRLKDGKSSRDQWKAWSEGFTPENVLDADSQKKVTWSFSPEAYEVDGTKIDRWTIEPTKEGVADIKKDAGPKLAEWEKRLGGLKVVIDRAEVDGRVLYLVAPAAEETYMKLAVAAVGGKDDLAGSAGLKSVLSASRGPSSVFAVDVKRGADWLRELLPPDDASKIPAALGNDLSDAYMAQSYSESGTQTGEFVVSQPFIDQLRALAD